MNAIYPGGGFLNGAVEQEESLCRCSTLYASISSEKASEMYEFNNTCNSKIYSDYMLLSKNVCVFRDYDCTLLENPYNVFVITVPAPNKNGRDLIISSTILFLLFFAMKKSCQMTLVLFKLFILSKKGKKNTTT